MTNVESFVELNCGVFGTLKQPDVSERGYLQQRRLQFQRRTQQFVRMNDIEAAFTMGVNDPTPAIRRNSAAIAPDPACVAKLFRE